MTNTRNYNRGYPAHHAQQGVKKILPSSHISQQYDHAIIPAERVALHSHMTNCKIHIKSS